MVLRMEDDDPWDSYDFESGLLGDSGEAFGFDLVVGEGEAGGQGPRREA